jgi:two-component system, chemotaxis family, chemotaxis protein CheY
MRTLIVEDDFTNRLVLQTYLARFGECQVAENGRQAVEEFCRSRQNGKAYDLICMDIMMPEMDGQEAVRQIRALEEAGGTFSTAGVKIIMVTALDDIKNVFSSFKALCDVYLFKPIDTEKLFAHLKSLDLIPK